MRGSALEGVFASTRQMLRDEAIHKNPEDWGGTRREAWEELDRIETVLRRVLALPTGAHTGPDGEWEETGVVQAQHLIEQAL